MQYLDIFSSINITPHTDNRKVMDYYQQMSKQSFKKVPYFDDYDLYSHMVRYNAGLTSRGITFHPIIKITSKNKSTDKVLTNFEQLHQQLDEKARHHRLHTSMSVHQILPVNCARCLLYTSTLPTIA